MANDHVIDKRIASIVRTGRQVYLAAVKEGFSANQSLQITIGLINNQCKSQGGKVPGLGQCIICGADIPDGEVVCKNCEL